MIKETLLKELERKKPDFAKVIRIINHHRRDKLLRGFFHDASDLEKIEALAAGCFRVDPEALKTNSRIQEVVWSRYFVFWYYVRLKGWTTTNAGLIYGKDHSTCVHGLKTLEVYAETKDQVVYKAFKKFRTKLKELEL